MNLVMPGAVPQPAAPCQLRVLPGVAGGAGPLPAGLVRCQPSCVPLLKCLLLAASPLKHVSLSAPFQVPCLASRSSQDFGSGKCQSISSSLRACLVLEHPLRAAGEREGTGGDPSCCGELSQSRVGRLAGMAGLYSPSPRLWRGLPVPPLLLLLRVACAARCVLLLGQKEPRMQPPVRFVPAQLEACVLARLFLCRVKAAWETLIAAFL